MSPGRTNVSAESFALATPGLPALRLGKLIDSDSGQHPSADATADDTTALADEDAIAPGFTADVTPGEGSYTVPSVGCTGSGFVAGWLDWNRNGVFDDGERSGPVACDGGSVDLTWDVPADAAGGAILLGLRRRRSGSA